MGFIITTESITTESNRLFEISEFNWTELFIFLHFQAKKTGNRIGFRRQPTPISTPDISFQP